MNCIKNDTIQLLNDTIYLTLNDCLLISINSPWKIILKDEDF